MIPTPQIVLTEHQQWALTISEEIEAMGWVGAAHALRRKHFPYLNWDDPKIRACTSRGFDALLRIHHGSKPPLSDFTPAPKSPTHHAAHPAQPITPAPRPDQTIA